MRTMAASAAASSRKISGPGTASLNPWDSRNGVIQSKPHSNGLMTRFSSRMVSRVSQSYIQRAYLLLSMVTIQVYQRALRRPFCLDAAFQGARARFTDRVLKSIPRGLKQAAEKGVNSSGE